MLTSQPQGLYGSSSPFSGTASLYSNPATRSFQQPLLEQQQAALMEAYNKSIEALRTQQQPQKATVFTDIATELKELTDDEKAFIMSSKEYQIADAKYQSEFSEFLISKFSDEFLQGHQRTMEELLGAIRTKKDQYRNKFADDVAEIKTQNETLANKNAELAKSNAALQQQLLDIQEKLSKGL